MNDIIKPVTYIDMTGHLAAIIEHELAVAVPLLPALRAR